MQPFKMLYHTTRLIISVVVFVTLLLGGCNGGGSTPSGYLTLSYFPFNVGDVYKYRSVDSSTSSTYLTEIDTVSLTNSDYLIRHKDNVGTYDEVQRIENNKIIEISSTDSLLQGWLPLTLYDLSLSENVARTIGNKSNLPYPDIDSDGLPETITTLAITQTLLPKELVTVDGIVFSDCAKIRTTISFDIATSTGVNITVQSIVTEWFASAIGNVKSTTETNVMGPGGSIPSTITHELLKYDVNGIKGGDWTPPSIAANAAPLTNQLQVPVSGATENGATVTATTAVAANSATADINGNYSVSATLEPNIQNTISISATDFVKNVNTMTVSVIQDSIPPASVTVSSTPLNGSVNLSWSASSDANGIAEYRVVKDSIPLGRTAGTTWGDASVNPGEKITYQVLAVDNAGNASIPNPTYVAIPPGGTGVFNTQFQLTWPANVGSMGSIQNPKEKLFVADIDNDGNRDMVAFSQTWGGDNYILTTLGPISATSQFTTANSPNNSIVIPHLVANADNDNKLEVLFVGPGILKWDAALMAWAGIPQTWTYHPNETIVAYGDINGDGIIDLLGSAPSNPNYYQGLGDGTFGNSGSSTTGIGVIAISADIKLSDVNRDGKIDIVAWDSVYLNLGAGNFLLSNQISNFSCLYFLCHYLVADVTGDGYPDIIYDDVPGTPRDIRVFINDGTGHFSTPSVATNIGTSWEFTTGDLNGDGIPDLIVEDGGTTVTIWWSAGNGSFSIGPVFSVSYYDKVIATDFDRDGDVDVVAYGSPGGAGDSAEIKIFLNQ